MSHIALYAGGFYFPISYDGSTGNIYYVATTGSDEADGSIGAPWATLTYAASQLEPGDTLYLRGGTWNEYLNVPNSGSPGRMITYEAYPGETPIVDGDGIWIADMYGVVNIRNKSYIRIKGLTVRNGNYPGQDVAGIAARLNVSHIEILNNTITNMNCSGILCGSGYTSANEINSYITVTGNEISYCNHRVSQEALTVCNCHYFDIGYNHLHHCWKEGLDVKGESDYGVVHHNTIHELSGPGIYLDARPIHHVDIHSNYVYSLGSQGASREQPIWAGFYKKMAGITLGSEGGSTIDYVNVYNNIIDESTLNGIKLSKTDSYDTGRIRHVNIYNNTIERGGDTVDSYSSNIVLPGAAYVDDIHIFNNLLWRRVPHPAWGIAIKLGSAIGDYTDLVIDHNLYEYFNDTYDEHGWIPGPYLGTNNVELESGEAVGFIGGSDPSLGIVNTYAESCVVTTGTETNTYASTAANDGTYHIVEDDAGNISFYYEFEEYEGDGRAYTAYWRFYAQPATAVVDMYAYNWSTETYVKLISYAGTDAATMQEKLHYLLAEYSDAGSGVNKVRLKIESSTADVIATDQIYCKNNPDVIVADDYKLAGTSPAIDVGATVDLDEDYYGNARPQGLGYDIGAFEYTPV